ncbi:MAG: type II toxin-antitoxin system HicB family antitoxin [Methylococcaceae bacterium]|nr:MAG: type II toxin-antitoxin system HicB family antitoxin [Methylococcaceae bacterium]
MGARAMTDQRFDGHTLNLYFDGEHWLAHFVEMPEVSAFAVTPENALLELQTAWELVKADYIEHGELPPSARHIRQAA